MIYAYLEDYTGGQKKKAGETRAICEIMNTGIAGGIIQGWAAYKARSGIRNTVLKRLGACQPSSAGGDGFQEITEEEARQMELPF